jgi:hypothetical protein
MIKTRYRRILWFFGRAIANFIWWDVLLPRLGLDSGLPAVETGKDACASWQSLSGGWRLIWAVS